MPSVSVVIPTFNRRAMLDRILAPLLAEPDALEIVVVVDGSRDGSLERLEAMAQADPRVRPELIENRGMVEARMHGVRRASGDVVLLIDDDVELELGTVRGHGEIHARDRRLVVVGAMPVVGGPEQHGPADYPRAMYAREYLRHCRRWEQAPDSVLATLWEGHLSMRRADLLALDPPVRPEIGRAYHCDVDFGLRCLHAGLRGVYVPQLAARHHFSRDPEQFVRDARSSGRGLLLIHGAHPGELGPFREEQLLDTLPRPVLALVRLALTRDRARSLIGEAILATGRLHLYRAQRLIAYAARVVEQLREVRRIRGCAAVKAGAP